MTVGKHSCPHKIVHSSLWSVVLSWGVMHKGVTAKLGKILIIDLLGS